MVSRGSLLIEEWITVCAKKSSSKPFYSENSANYAVADTGEGQEIQQRESNLGSGPLSFTYGEPAFYLPSEIKLAHLRLRES